MIHELIDGKNLQLGYGLLSQCSALNGLAPGTEFSGVFVTYANGKQVFVSKNSKNQTFHIHRSIQMRMDGLTNVFRNMRSATSNSKKIDVVVSNGVVYITEL